MSREYHFGLLGHRISYSLSPDIFRAIAAHSRVAIDFSLVDIPGEKLELTLQELSHRGFDGLAVTIPHKNRLSRHLTALDPLAERIGAVNSVKIEGANLTGYNTDVYGFGLPLAAFRERLEGRAAVIVGSGGAARAVLFSLLVEFGVSEVFVCARTVAHMAQLTADALRFAAKGQVTPCPLVELERVRDAAPAILVNCTPLGGFSAAGAPIESSPFPIDIAPIYYDLNYNADNLLIANAYRAGITAIDGTAMLVGQAVRSFELWTGLSVPHEAVYEAVFGHRDPERGE